MFEDEELADNLVEEQATSPVEKPVDQTKAFATRLKEATAKAREEEREEIAKSFGYTNWNEYKEAQTNNKLLDKGLDPESVRPVLKDLIQSDPDYIQAMQYKAEKEELEKEIFASNSIKDLNAKYGTDFKSVQDLDENTIKMWNMGIPLDSAYAANNVDKIVESAKRKITVDSGKEHLKTITNSGAKTELRELTSAQKAAFRAFGFSDKQVEEYRKSHK